MQKTVDSIRSEVKEELKMEQVRGDSTVQEFNVENILDKYSGNPELWSLWYPQVYEEIFNAVNLILEAPLDDKNAEPQDAYLAVENGVEDLIDYVSNANKDTQHLLNIRERIHKFQNRTEDELTIIVTIHGGDSRIECVDGYYDEGIVTVDMNGTPTNAESSSLREYEGTLTDAFCDWSPYKHRPNNRFKRELHISLKKSDGGEKATIDLESTRMEYTLMEKLLLKMGLSSPYAEEPINEIS